MRKKTKKWAHAAGGAAECIYYNIKIIAEHIDCQHSNAEHAREVTPRLPVELATLMESVQARGSISLKI